MAERHHLASAAKRGRTKRRWERRRRRRDVSQSRAWMREDHEDGERDREGGLCCQATATFFSLLPSLLTLNHNCKTPDSFTPLQFCCRKRSLVGQRCRLCSVSARSVGLSALAGIRCMPAGQQGWPRCGARAVGRLGTVGLLIREL